MSNGTILVVDDDRTILHFLRLNLAREGYTVLTATEGRSAVELVEMENPDLVVLDLILPDIDGFEVCRCIRVASDAPIIMLTARGDQHDIIRGLDLGADDYMIKPFGAGELVARARAVLRRVRPVGGESRCKAFQAGDLCIDFARRVVSVRGREIQLRPTEYRLLSLLAHHANKVVSREELIAKVWGGQYAGQYDLLRTYIKYLRQRIEPDSVGRRYLETFHGFGYLLRSEPAQD